MGDSCKRSSSPPEGIQDPSQRTLRKDRFWRARHEIAARAGHLKDHFLAMVETWRNFGLVEIFRLAVLISTFESSSAYARVVTLPESIPVRYTEEDAGT